MDRKATPWRPVSLCWERLRDFSDSLRRDILGNSERGGHEKGRGMVVPALLQRSSLVALQEKRY
jgi:hypothetical protein